MMSEAELIEIDNRAVQAACEVARTNERLRQVLAPVFRDLDRLIADLRKRSVPKMFPGTLQRADWEGVMKLGSSNIGQEGVPHDPHD